MIVMVGNCTNWGIRMSIGVKHAQKQDIAKRIDEIVQTQITRKEGGKKFNKKPQI